MRELREPAVVRVEEYSVERVPWRPEELERGVIYLCGEERFGPPALAIFLCPCGCGGPQVHGYSDGLIQLNLTGSVRSHRWGHEVHEDGTITIAPSILRLNNCKSHFFIRRSRVEWA
jgi:hypothetical protein